MNHKELQKNIWPPFTPLEIEIEPIMVESAKGVYLHSSDGRKILDAVSSWWVNIHGHSNEHIAKKVGEQASKLEHVIFAGFTHEPALTLSKNLLSILPENQEKIFFSDDGSTAVEVGMKMACQYWYNKGITNRTKLIAIDGAYHGDTFGAMAVGGKSAFTAPFDPFLFDVEYIDFPNSENETRVLERFEKIVSSGETTAFIFEPLVQGSAGMRMYSPETLNKLLSIAHQHHVICIADEVMTGFGRTGKIFATDHIEEKPDIYCLSKGLTGGSMALGVTTCSSKIVDAYRSSDIMKTFFHGHSFTANPIACAAANASFDILTSDECQQNIKRVTEQHRQFAEGMKGHSRLRNVRQQGTIIALELETGDSTSYFNKDRDAIYKHFIAQDILLRPLGNVIYILPPYIISDAELKRVYDSIEEFLEQ